MKNLSHSNFELYCKGSPEMISSLCLPETIPDNFSSVLTEYTQHGYRVIALAHRQIDLTYTKLQRVERYTYIRDIMSKVVGSKMKNTAKKFPKLFEAS